MNTKKGFPKLILVTFLLLLNITTPLSSQSLDLTEAEAQYIRENPTVTVSLLSSWAPFEFIDEKGGAGGYSADYLRLLCRRAGLTPRFIKNKPWKEYLALIQRGELDIINSVVKTPEREEFLLFTPIFYTSHPGLVLPARKAPDSLTLKELVSRPSPARPLIFPAGFYYEEFFQTRYPDTNYKTVPSTKEGVKELIFHEGFALLGDLPVLRDLLRRYNLVNLRVIPLLQVPEFDSALRLGIQRKKPLLHSILEKAASSVSHQEEAVLRERWLTPRSDSRTPLLTLEEQLYLDSKTEITVVTDPTWTPLAFIDGEGDHAGIAAEYLSLISQRLDKPIRLIPTENWGESWTLAKKGKADIVSALMETEERKEYCLFTNPYLLDPFVVIQKQGTPYSGDIRSLGASSVGVVDNYATEMILRKRYPRLNLVEVSNITEGLEKVSRGELDAFVDSLATASYQIGKLRLMNLKIAGEMDEQWEIAFGVNPRESSLLSILNKTLDTITPAEEEEIWQQWINVNYEYQWDARLLRNILLALGGVGLLILWRFLLIRKKNAQLKALAITDPLTQLHNRLEMNRSLKREISRSQRTGRPFTLIILDIDHFKEVNDQYGHNAGDKVLKRMALTLKASIRETDILGRWGGEEFLLLCPETTLSEGRGLAERLRRALESIDHSPCGIITASFGGARWHPGENSTQLIQRADQMLYQAKEEGRNCVIFSPDP